MNIIIIISINIKMNYYINIINNNVSNSNIIIKKDFIFSFILFQLESIAIGIIIVVNKIKKIEIPSIPKYISNNCIL